MALQESKASILRQNLPASTRIPCSTHTDTTSQVMLRASFKVAAAARPASALLRRAAVPTFAPVRFYAASSLSKQDIEARVLNIVKAFDKVKDPSKISATSTFANDLGLDSLDTVEVVMAIEEEFNVEIPDKEADEIKSVGQAIEYIAANGDGEYIPSGMLSRWLIDFSTMIKCAKLL